MAFISAFYSSSDAVQNVPGGVAGHIQSSHLRDGKNAAFVAHNEECSDYQQPQQLAAKLVACLDFAVL